MPRGVLLRHFMAKTHFDSLVQDLPPLLKKKECAAFLRSHEQTVADLVRTGELLAISRRAKQGSPVLIVRDSLRDYCERNQR
jgi:hypothetical protein